MLCHILSLFFTFPKVKNRISYYVPHILPTTDKSLLKLNGSISGFLLSLSSHRQYFPTQSLLYKILAKGLFSLIRYSQEFEAAFFYLRYFSRLTFFLYIVCLQKNNQLSSYLYTSPKISLHDPTFFLLRLLTMVSYHTHQAPNNENMLQHLFL